MQLNEKLNVSSHLLDIIHSQTHKFQWSSNKVLESISLNLMNHVLCTKKSEASCLADIKFYTEILLH